MKLDLEFFEILNSTECNQRNSLICDYDTHFKRKISDIKI